MAAALGKVDAFNLFDPQRNDLEYDIYYKMLDAGIKLPASTGSDWFICNGNRVYADCGGQFEYEAWAGALKEGRTFITNGPALALSVEGEGPGAALQVEPGRKLPARVDWTSHYPVDRVEVLFNDKVVAGESFPEGSKGGHLEADVTAGSDGWVAARVSSHVRDSYSQPMFAHTSPVYVHCGVDGPERAHAARYFVDSIEDSLRWVRTKGKFYNDNQRREVLDLFREGQQVYRAMLR